MADQNDILVNSLKYNVKKFNNKYQKTEEQLTKVILLMIKEWVKNYNSKEDHDPTPLWELVAITKTAKHLDDTSIVGVYTEINLYTNKRNITTEAHYTMFGKYYGSIKKLGNKPIGYKGYVPITKDKFKYKYNKDAKDLDDFFVPK